MTDSIEAIIVGLYLLFPGFLSGLVERVLSPRRFASDFEWAATSVIRSLLLNLAGMSVALLIWAPTDALSGQIDALGAWVHRLPLSFALEYTVVIYMFAVAWGIAVCRVKWLSLHEIGRRLSWTSATASDSVWDKMYTTRLKRDQGKRPWVRCQLKDGRYVFGRLRESSLYVDQDKPIEVFLSPVYVETSAGLEKPAAPDELSEHVGIYYRVDAETAVDLVVADPGWIPPLAA